MLLDERAAPIRRVVQVVRAPVRARRPLELTLWLGGHGAEMDRECCPARATPGRDDLVGEGPGSHVRAQADGAGHTNVAHAIFRLTGWIVTVTLGRYPGETPPNCRGVLGKWTLALDCGSLLHSQLDERPRAAGRIAAIVSRGIALQDYELRLPAHRCRGRFEINRPLVVACHASHRQYGSAGR